MPEEKIYHEVDHISCNYIEPFKCRISYQKYTLEKKEKAAERIKVDVIGLGSIIDYTPVWQRAYTAGGMLSISLHFPYKEPIKCKYYRDDEGELILYCEREK